MKTKITPVGKKVLIKPKEAERLVPGTNIIIPDTALEKVYQGHVVAVGAEVQEIKPGDLIQYADYCVPTEMKHDGQRHLLINAGDIFAILEVIE
jgi:co-chaperonin GroES (HSP10)